MGRSISLPQIILLCVFVSPTLALSSESQPTPGDSLIVVSLTDGTSLRGTIILEDTSAVTIMTITGLEIEVPRSVIANIEPLSGRVIAGVYYRSDPNTSRLLFAPTGRPLLKGEGYLTDYWVLFPGVAYGVTNNFTILAGVSVIPGLGISEQIKYIAPRVGFRASPNTWLSAGVLFVSFFGEFSAGIAFAVATHGAIDKSFTYGLGLGFSKSGQGETKFADYPILLLGGSTRLSNSLALVSENWIFLSDNFELSNQPLSLALRFFGDRIAVDLGGIITLGTFQGGFPIPWLSFVYNFRR